jgi:CheY-like chemotaxis protein
VARANFEPTFESMNKQIQHILLVDDDQDDRYFFATALEEVDPSVRLSTAAEGGEAYEKLSRIKPDLILLDLVMPGINGVTFLKLVKRDPALAGIPVVVYTSDLSIFEEQDVTALGAAKVIIKANDFGGTVEHIAGLLNISQLKQSA